MDLRYVYGAALKLGVNIDHVATLRQARRGNIPGIIEAAGAAAAGGADWITVHLRQDRRHIQDRDVYALKDWGVLPINLEMAVSEEIMEIVLEIRPWCACLVPEKREELTTEGGLDVAGGTEKLKEAASRLRAAGIEVSFFIDPDERQVEACIEAGADTVELHTGPYANASGRERQKELMRLGKAARLGAGLGLKVNAGHGLDYENVAPVSSIPEVSELNIGYSIICRAIFTGLERAVRDMENLL